MSDTVELRAVNKVMGDVFTVNVNPYDPDSLASCLQDIQGTMKALKQLEEDVKKIQFDAMGDEKSVPVLGGKFEWKLIAGQRKSYSVPVALEYFDQDELISTGALSLATGKYETLIKQQVAEGSLPAEASKEIAETTELTPIKPHVKLNKVT